MGKSDKKVRAESINRLRKQYDAFLEEDRKRKERNDDILSKLDKMRYSVTRHKGNVYLDTRSPLISYDAISTNVFRSTGPQVPMKINIPNQNAEETFLLSQITKKYILIPRLRPMIENDYSPTVMQRDISSDSDWKNKYSILDKLKQTEKEEDNNATLDKGENINYHDLSSELWRRYRKNDDQTEDKVNLDKFEEKNITLTSPKKSQDLQCKESEIKQIYRDDPTEEPVFDSKVKETSAFELAVSSHANAELKMSHYNDDNSTARNDDDQQLNLNLDNNLKISNSVIDFAVTEVHEKVESNLYKNIAVRHNSGENDSKHEIEGTEKTNFDFDDTRHVEVSHAKQGKPEDSLNSGDFESRNNPINITNVQDVTPSNDVILVDGININPEGYDANYAQSYQYSPETTVFAEQDENISHQESVNVIENETDSTQQYVNPEDPIVDEAYNETYQQYSTTSDMENVLGIQAFEAEQNEMFYSEQPAPNYEQYNEHGETYNAEYNKPMEGYDPTTYYEHAQQEAFNVEINEHEETSQRYDPVYEQQYVTTNAEDAQYADQTQYAETAQNPEELTPTILEFDQTQNATDQLGITEQVEQQLDSEAGYVQNKLDDIIQGVDGSTPTKQIPDETLHGQQHEANVVAPEKQM